MPDLRRKVDYFAAQVESIPLYDDWHDLTNLLVTRDGIQDELEEGVHLGAELSTTLNHADEQLRQHRAQLIRTFPDAFELGKTAPRKRWWWHPNE